MKPNENLPAPYPEVGDAVIFHDAYGKPHNALITCVHGSFEHSFRDHGIPCVNLIHVSGEQAKQDQYGRQTEHSSSAVHKSRQGAHGNYWRWPDEAPNPVAPAQS